MRAQTLLLASLSAWSLAAVCSVEGVQIDLHPKGIAPFQHECRDDADPALKAFAAKTLPILRRHLLTLQSLPPGG